MDFLDSLDLNVPQNNKTHRVRSWYLYEQFKSLERNQLDAARKLKSRSTQDRLLRQELSERKTRRKLYNQCGTCQSESGFEHSLESESTKKSLDVSSNDFFDSFHELQEDEGLDACIEDNDSQTVKFYDEDFTSADEPIDDQSFEERINSVVNNKSEDTLAEDLDKYIEIENKTTKFEDLELNFDVVKEKLQCLKKLSHMRDGNKFSETEGSSIEDDKIKQTMKEDKNENSPENNVYFVWSKLVSFSYQIMQLNHGNCYYDYGSQLLTAVLACDVLRRGISRMCHILQPYVSPIKFATDSVNSYENQQNIQRKSPQASEQSKSHEYKRHYPNRRLKNPRTKSEATRRYRSKDICQKRAPFTIVQNKVNGRKYSWASEPGRRISKLTASKKYSTSKSSYRTLWPTFSSEDTTKKCLCIMTCTCRCHKVVNPMLRISNYLDRIMRDIDDPLFI